MLFGVQPPGSSLNSASFFPASSAKGNPALFYKLRYSDTPPEDVSQPAGNGLSPLPLSSRYLEHMKSIPLLTTGRGKLPPNPLSLGRSPLPASTWTLAARSKKRLAWYTRNTRAPQNSMRERDLIPRTRPVRRSGSPSPPPPPGACI